MKYEEKWIYSHCLERTTNIKIYGHYGIPFLVFPCQDKASDDWANNGMIDALKDFIEEGRIKLICVDSIDQETYSSFSDDYGRRSYLVEQYYYYIIDEVLPLIYESCGGFIKPYVTGCSMGATHASIMFFRRPDLFSGIIGLSGCYDTRSFFNGWCDERLYNNCPNAFLKNMPQDHNYIKEYNSKNIIFCTGKGSYEYQVDWTFYILRDMLNEKGIDAWMDVWGEDCAHDWYWWRRQICYFIKKIV